ncbi:hypothetical protein VULLAG_LOCUS14236 [Vulpes lagopus]
MPRPRGAPTVLTAARDSPARNWPPRARCLTDPGAPADSWRHLHCADGEASVQGVRATSLRGCPGEVAGSALPPPVLWILILSSPLDALSLSKPDPFVNSADGRGGARAPGGRQSPGGPPQPPPTPSPPARTPHPAHPAGTRQRVDTTGRVPTPTSSPGSLPCPGTYTSACWHLWPSNQAPWPHPPRGDANAYASLKVHLPVSLPRSG